MISGSVRKGTFRALQSRYSSVSFPKEEGRTDVMNVQQVERARGCFAKTVSCEERVRLE